MHKRYVMTGQAMRMQSRRMGAEMAPPEGPRGGRGRGRGRGRQAEPPAVTAEELNAWFAGNLPDAWFIEAPRVAFDRDEILVTGKLPMPKLADGDGSEAAGGEAKTVAAHARIAAFREDSRVQRMAIAERAQTTYQRTVSWAAECGDVNTSFKTASVPVMTRLDLQERALLDTLIDAGVARSRSEALAWCVELVSDNESEWIGDLRTAMESVAEVRKSGPASRG